MLLHYFAYVEGALYLAISLAGIVGAALAATTRGDAYEAAGRQSRWAWTGILVLSAVAVFTRAPFLAWIGMVAIGLYWFDVRPQIKDILNGNYGW